MGGKSLGRKITPRRIRLEAATVCQLKCPVCSTTTGKIKNNIGAGFLRFEDFKELVDENPWVCDVELSNWGEIFLNPDLLNIIEYAYGKHVSLRADNGVNFNTASDELLEALVKYRFRSMTCSIDGASQETYAIYRRRGNFENVIEHIKRINDYKTQYRSEFPLLQWQFVAFGHNEHEIRTARQMAKNLKMSFYVKLSYSDTFSPVKDKEVVRRESGLGVASEEEFRAKYGGKYLTKSICAQLWKRPQINWDGRVLGCCVNYWGDFGDAFKDGLVNSLNNEKINYARQMLLGKKPERDAIPCTTCSYYKRRKEDHAWLRPSDVRDVWRPSRFQNMLANTFIGPTCMRMLVTLRNWAVHSLGAKRYL
jgi:MoaA/NifB/PqqE/SkfB family radical SAM enzyme